MNRIQKLSLHSHETSRTSATHRQYRAFHEVLAGCIPRRIEEGALRMVDPLFAAWAFFGTIIHHRLLPDLVGLPRHLPREDMVAEYVSRFRGGLAQQLPDS